MLINKDTDYAIRTLVHMKDNDREKYTSSELSEELEIPYPFLRSIMQKLSKEGVVDSHRGRSGGFSLNRGDIEVVELVRIFQGEVKLNECVIKGNLCPDIGECRLKDEIEDIREYIIERLGSLTIEALVNEEKSKEQL